MPWGGQASLSVDAVAVVRNRGGAARWSDLAAAGVTWRGISRAVRAGQLVAVDDGTYALPATNRDVIAAVQANGYLSHTSAARLWMLDVLNPPAKPHVAVPHNRGRSRMPADVHLHYVDRNRLETVNIPWPVTTLERTLVDCARTLPFHEALVVIDSALRSGKIDEEAVRTLAHSLRGPGSAAARRALRAGDKRSASMGETLTRAAALDAGLPAPELQFEVGFDDGSRAFFDLAWRYYRGREVRVAAEFDGYLGHGKADFIKDRRRHNKLVVADWERLIYTMPDVLYHYRAVGQQIAETLEDRWRTAPPAQGRE